MARAEKEVAGDLSKIEFVTSEEVEVTPVFKEMNLKKDLLRGIYTYGFKEPSAIQARAIQPIIKGRDVIAQAQSRTGKTSMIAIASLQLIDINLCETQVLTLSPTMELALQIQKVILALGDYMNIQYHMRYRGLSMAQDMNSLYYRQHVVSGTPGSVFEMIQRRMLRTGKISTLILDEADEMMDKGFKEQIYQIYRHLSPGTQVLLISATMSHEILEMTSKFMINPIRILVKRDGLTLDGIKQYFVSVEREECKFDTLCNIYETVIATQVVIFCNTKLKVEWLADKMRNSNFSVSMIHGGMRLNEREEIMRQFRALKTVILITTDVWASGIDVEHVSLFINYDLPNNRELYIHRIGLSGRYSRNGMAINFVKSDEVRILRDIEQFYATQIDEMPMNIPKLVR